jgi:hypothetical protein
VRRVFSVLLVMLSLAGTPALAVTCELLCLNASTEGAHKHHDAHGAPGGGHHVDSEEQRDDLERLHARSCDHAPPVPSLPEVTIAAAVMAVPPAVLPSVLPDLHASSRPATRDEVPIPSRAFSPLRI